MPEPQFVFRAFTALIVASVTTASAAAAGRHVIFVDNRSSGGNGSSSSPFATLAAAQQVSRIFDVIFVAETDKPYEESISLAKGQMLIGSAYGLDAVQSEMKITVDAPPAAAAQGTGPVIHGTISLTGDNAVAGCTIIADRKTGVGLSTQTPEGPIDLRTLHVRTSADAYALYVDNNTFPVTWTNGSLHSTEGGAGILINRGNGNVIVDHVPVGGEFGSAIAIRGRTGGSVTFRNGSAVKIGGASREAVAITNSLGSVVFDSPLQIRTAGGRGLVVNHAGRVTVSGGSWIETTNATALDVRDSGVEMMFDHISADGVAPGRLTEAIVLDKVRGRFEITGNGSDAGSGGVIRNALSYGMRATQSIGIRVRNLTISGGGTLSSPEECPADVPGQTNLRCRAALFLRHIEQSSFDNINIAGNGSVGLNVNNATDVAFNDVHVTGAGDQQSEPALLFDEARGRISFVRCSFIDGGGGAVVIEQRFNSAILTFDRCDIGAPQRPSAGSILFRARTSGKGRLQIEITNTLVHDNAGGGAALVATEESSGALTIRDSHFDRLGSTAIDVDASKTASVTIILSGNHVLTPAVSKPLIDVHLADSSSACIDAMTNELAGGGPAAVRVSTRSARTRLQVVRTDGMALPDRVCITTACP